MKLTSFIVPFWDRIFWYLRKYSPVGYCLEMLQKSFAKNDEKKYFFTDLFVMIQLLIAILFWLVIGKLKLFVGWFFVILVAFRLYDMTVYHVNVVLFDEYRKRMKLESYSVFSYRRIVLCLLSNYAEALFLFAMLYQFFNSSFKQVLVCPNLLLGSLYFSIATMTTLGYGDITPLDGIGMSLCIAQTLIGVFLAVVMFAAFIRLLPIPKTNNWRERD